MLRLNCEAFGGYCRGCYPWIPTWRPNTLTRTGVGRADQLQTVVDRTTCCTGSFQRYRDRIRPSLSRDTVVIQLGLLPCKPTRTPSYNPAPRVYKGSRGTPLEHPRSQPQHLETTKSQNHRAILSRA